MNNKQDHHLRVSAYLSEDLMKDLKGVMAQDRTTPNISQVVRSALVEYIVARTKAAQ